MEGSEDDMTGADPAENTVIGRIGRIGDRDGLEGREGGRSFEGFRLLEDLIILVVRVFEGE